MTKYFGELVHVEQSILPTFTDDNRWSVSPSTRRKRCRNSDDAFPTYVSTLSSKLG